MRSTLMGLDLLLLSGVTPGLALDGVCQCLDLGDIKLRLRKAQAAIRMYREQIEVAQCITYMDPPCFARAVFADDRQGYDCTYLSGVVLGGALPFCFVGIPNGIFAPASS